MFGYNKMKYDYEALSEIALKLISQSNASKSFALESISSAKKGDFRGADEKLEKANQAWLSCQKQHTALIQDEAAGQSVDISILLAHALDQVTSAETIILLANELIDLYRK